MTTWEISAGEMRGEAGKSGVFFRSFSSRALIYKVSQTGSSPIAEGKKSHHLVASIALTKNYEFRNGSNEPLAVFWRSSM